MNGVRWLRAPRLPPANLRRASGAGRSIASSWIHHVIEENMLTEAVLLWDVTISRAGSASESGGCALRACHRLISVAPPALGDSSRRRWIHHRIEENMLTEAVLL